MNRKLIGNLVSCFLTYKQLILNSTKKGEEKATSHNLGSICYNILMEIKER